VLEREWIGSEGCADVRVELVHVEDSDGSEWSWFMSRTVMAQRVGVIREEARRDATRCLSVNTGRKLCKFTEV
jgi:hypothetical protein